MDVETPTRGRDRAERMYQGRAEESTRDSLANLYLGGLIPLHKDVSLGRPRTPPKMPMMSPNSMDVLGGRIGSLENPKKG
jgi:hypothetical protein